MNKYRVWTQYFYNGKWYSAGDNKSVETAELAHKKGEELIKEQRTDFMTGLVRLETTPVPRRYLIAEVIYTSEAI
jgi:hypothetical protein